MNILHKDNLSDMPKDISEQMSPPYSSTTALQKLFDLLYKRSLKVIDRGYLNAYGISGSEGFVAMKTLKFLGIVNEQGETTDLAKKFHLQGEPKLKEIQGMIKRAYQPIFDRAPNAYSLDTGELINEFIGAYQITARIAQPAVRAFIWLCEEAGLREKKASAEAARNDISSPRKNLVSRPKKQKSGEMILTTTPIIPVPSALQVYKFAGGIELRVPVTERVSEAILNGGLKPVSDAIKKFADTHGLINDAARSQE